MSVCTRVERSSYSRVFLLHLRVKPAPLELTGAHSSSLRVAVPSPRGKREGGNVYEKLARIVLCDVTLLHGNI